jgi:hypothetical protein
VALPQGPEADSVKVWLEARFIDAEPLRSGLDTPVICTESAYAVAQEI